MSTSTATASYHLETQKVLDARGFPFVPSNLTWKTLERLILRTDFLQRQHHLPALRDARTEDSKSRIYLIGCARIWKRMEIILLSFPRVVNSYLIRELGQWWSHPPTISTLARTQRILKPSVFFSVCALFRQVTDTLIENITLDHVLDALSNPATFVQFLVTENGEPT